MPRLPLWPLLALGAVLLPAPAAADWYVLHEVESGRIQMVALMTPAEIANQLQAPGPRPGLGRLHYKGAELPSPWRCRVTPAKTIVCDETTVVTVAPAVTVTTTTTTQITGPARYTDSGKDIRVPAGPPVRLRANREVGWTDRMYVYERPGRRLPARPTGEFEIPGEPLIQSSQSETYLMPRKLRLRHLRREPYEAPPDFSEEEKRAEREERRALEQAPPIEEIPLPEGPPPIPPLSESY